MNALAYVHGSSMLEAVEKSFEHWEVRRQAAAEHPDLTPRTAAAFSVALSREAGTLGTAVAQEAGKLLGWHVYDHELLEHIAKEMGLRTSLLESVDERQQRWLVDVMEAFMSMPAASEVGTFVSQSKFVHQLVQTALALGIHGECIIVGRGASFILPQATTLRVRLVGPLRERVLTLSHTLGISEAEAARQVRTLDRERTDFVRDHFLQDPTNAENYDLILNTARLSVVKSAEMIVEGLRRLESERIPS